jgi:hypothetical protein
MLNSDSICNFVELIKGQGGFWIVMEKAISSLLDYLPKIKPHEVPLILRNIAKSY